MDLISPRRSPILLARRALALGAVTAMLLGGVATAEPQRPALTTSTAAAKLQAPPSIADGDPATPEIDDSAECLDARSNVRHLRILVAFRRLRLAASRSAWRAARSRTRRAALRRNARRYDIARGRLNDAQNRRAELCQ